MTSGNTKIFLEALEVMTGKGNSTWIDFLSSNDPDLYFRKFCNEFRRETGIELTNEDIREVLEEMNIL